jgi:hypothetical protein
VANFEQWKVKIEAAASGIVEDHAAIAKLQADSLQASFSAICKTVVDGFEAVINAGLPLETATVVLEENLSGGMGLRTSEIQGTLAFHGSNTLSLRQIARLLRKSGKAKAKFCGSGSYTYNLWTLPEEVWDQACNRREEFFAA